MWSLTRFQWLFIALLLAALFQGCGFQLRGQIDYCELSTPLSTDYFCDYRHGEMYGLKHDPGRFDQAWLRPATKVKGLYLTGQDILTCGVGGAMFGGLLAALSALGWRGATLLKSLAADGESHQAAGAITDNI